MPFSQNPLMARFCSSGIYFYIHFCARKSKNLPWNIFFSLDACLSPMCIRKGQRNSSSSPSATRPRSTQRMRRALNIKPKKSVKLEKKGNESLSVSSQSMITSFALKHNGSQKNFLLNMSNRGISGYFRHFGAVFSILRTFGDLPLAGNFWQTVKKRVIGIFRKCTVH